MKTNLKAIVAALGVVSMMAAPVAAKNMPSVKCSVDRFAPFSEGGPSTTFPIHGIGRDFQSAGSR